MVGRRIILRMLGVLNDFAESQITRKNVMNVDGECSTTPHSATL